MGFYFIIGAVIALFGGINYYIGAWLWNTIFIEIPFVSENVYWIIFSLLVVGSLIGVIWNRYLPRYLQKSSYLASSYWFGSMVYLTIFITIFRIIGLLNKSIDMDFISSFNAGLLLLVIVLGLLAYGSINAKNLKVTSYDIEIPKEVGTLEELHVALLSDIHLNSLQDKGMKKLVDKINSIKPDIVLIAGDIIDANRDRDFKELKLKEYNFKKIKSTYGIYASLGNHDYDDKGDSAYRIERFKQAGVNVLRDSTVKIADSFYLIGREDKFYERISRQKRKKVSVLMEDIDRKLPIIALDHQPVDLEEAEEAGVDLQLSGHTHKGQMFPFSLITNKVFKVDYGYLKMKELQVIVSSGARTWGPPIRIGSSSEVVDIIIHFTKK
ncbi:metallophosphoesterase [Clostridium sp. BL-8]|uniref:metallophosphoesterase n=1 Tax=Clostridium sp. BL-8 TaxID=349938 RepID=UPI00098C4196|nr:metallophosphoesterase [Clostridium sp. BL-8]OOM78889.1 putative metallophosphoesterase [Clostridium sp. BL-8]